MRPRRSARRPAHRTRDLRLEVMEGRQLLATIIVNTAADADVRDAALSLREAIEVANGTLAAASLSVDEQAQVAGAVTSPAPDTINFNIPGPGVQTIVLASDVGLPAITDPVVIDGYTQPGASPNTNPITAGSNAVLRIQLDESAVAQVPFAGLTLQAGGSTIRGLILSNSTGAGLAIGEGFGGNTIAGNSIGTNPAGTAAAGNTVGVYVQGPNNTIGGISPADRNIISGNNIGIYTFQQIGLAAVSGNRIEGNFIGTDAAGTAAIPNRTSGINLSTSADTTIGGTTAAARNLISGNFPGYAIEGSPIRPVIQGNSIGVDVTGTVALLDGTGLRLSETVDATIGGTAPGAGNIIASAGVGIDLGPTSLGSTGAVIQGNFIGTDPSGTVNLGNSGFGIFALASRDTTIGGTAAGAANLIAFTKNGGVGVSTNTTLGNSILGNSIFQNAGPGIQDGPPGPTLTSATATTILGTLAAASGTTYRVEFFATPDTGGNAKLQGKTFLGSQDVTTDANGRASFTFLPAGGVPAGQFLTATATGPDRSTSNFSSAIKATAASASADLAVSVADTPDPVAAGAGLAYDITVTNDGPDAASGVTLTTSVPAGATFVSFTAPAGWTATTPAAGGTGPVSATAANLGTAGAGPAAFRLVVHVAPDAEGGSTLNLSAGVSATTGDPSAANNSAAATTTVAVAPPPNTSPTAAADAYSTTAGVALRVPARGVLGNDTDAEGDVLSAVLEARPAHGAVVLSGDGSFAYTPAAGFSGVDTFTYRASDGRLTSAPATVTLTVAAAPPPQVAPTTTTVVATPPTSTVGQSVTFTATVSPASAGAGTPTGSVTFREGATVLKVVRLGGDRRAAFSTSALAPGAHSITASYGGDARFAPSRGATIETVRKAARLGTTTTPIASPNPSIVGRSVTFTATVSAAGGVAGTPTGRVTFREGATVLKVVALGGNRRAAFSTSALAPGLHTITASYGGDAAYAPSSGSTSETVNVVAARGDGPVVTDVQRFGFHWMPTTVVLTFSAPLNPSLAQDPSNYTILAPTGRRILVGSASYDPVRHTVALHPLERLDVHRGYTLMVNGSGARALSDLSGRALDGRRQGRPGSDFITVIDYLALVRTGPAPG